MDFFIKSVCKTGEEDDNEDEDAMLVPIYVGAISSKYVGEDNRLTGDRRGHAAEGFFGCDEFGHLYISGHRTDDKFGGFKKGSTVGVEIDYTDEAKRAMFISVDGFRVGAIRREVDEGMVPCVIFERNGTGGSSQRGSPPAWKRPTGQAGGYPSRRVAVHLQGSSRAGHHGDSPELSGWEGPMVHTGEVR